MDIVICLDKGFVMPAGVMMYSVCANNQNTEIMFHLVVDESVSDADRNDLRRTVESFQGKKVTFYTLEGRNFTGLPALEGAGVTQAAYYRLFLTEILPNNLDKVLYLDGDIIVRHSLLPLWNTDLADYAVAAVTDYSENNKSIYERLNYPRRFSYFNSGVLLANLKYWREHDVVKIFNIFLRDHKSEIVYWDQDVLNAVFYNKNVKLPIKFNTTIGYYKLWAKYDHQKYDEEVLEASKDPVIIHYTERKPWNYNRYCIPYVSSFFKYQSQTCWKNYPINDKRPLKLRIKHLVADAIRKIKLWPPLPCIYFDIPPVD